MTISPNKLVAMFAAFMPDLNKALKKRKSAKHQGTWVGVRTEPKIGRNKPCPCGSDFKYKKCCLNKGIIKK
jgi:uncharacterized protein YecA (UPF0149 family)